ncbi:sigma-70 family RNA polymerase sigma factor [Iocasia frigidifontis]|uniref:Sigma-70 family RNA polymerase sigma factor n=1 Tax=Iocasia fonsfrigidae TaxID=2682810 RepID=A0A8A7K7I5_9FIRM|nr:sigma-70 family RNA polymerase sigma factor [Iocasia fonsfrigidae]
MKVVEISDKELIKKFRNNDESAFEELVLRYQKKVYNTVLRMLSNLDDASDITQEIFIKVYQNLEKFKGQSSFSTWLFSIAGNHCRDELRKRQKELKHSSLDSIAEERKETERVSDNNSNYQPEERSIQNEQFRDIEIALSKLSIEYRESLVLRDIQGFTYDEISKILGLPAGTVKSRLSRARRKLRDELSKISRRRKEI